MTTLLAIVLGLLVGTQAPDQVPAADPVHVTFEEIDDVLPNPFKGFAPWTGAETPVYPKMLEKATVPWRLVEPEEGKIDWDFIERDWPSMDNGARAGLRIAAAYPGGEEPDLPQWLVDKGIPMHPYEIDGKPGLAPDWDDPRFLEAHQRLISALGARYDGDPRLAWLDIGSYGFWGEWHVFENQHLAGTEDTKRQILEHYFEAFPTTPMVIAFDDDFATQYVLDNGGGIRNDCLGRESSNQWYRESMRRVDPTILDEVWKRAVITGEFCGGGRGAVIGTTEGFDVTLAFVKETHWSWIGPAGGAIEPVDEQHRANLDLLMKTLGYRFVIRNATHPASAPRGDSWPIELSVENVGVAPFYFDWQVDLLFEHDDSGTTHIIPVDVDIRDWLPGTHQASLVAELPESMEAGTYSIRLGIIDPKTGKPGIYFANTGRHSDGRYQLSKLEVR